MAEEKEDYAVLAAKEWLAEPAPGVYLNCDCHHCQGWLITNNVKINALAAVIRKHAEQWAHDYSCGCM